MIVQELIGENIIRTYSDAGFYIYGGFPKGNYIEALDPVDKYRKYVETNLPIETNDDPRRETEEDRFAALEEKRLKFEEEYQKRINEENKTIN